MTMIPHTIGCVSFLNSKPLIEPLTADPRVSVHFAVPSALLGLVDSGQVSVALLPVVDYQASRHALLIAPVGAIACDGPTLTVRIYSKVEPGRIEVLRADTDSHTSVILAQVILRERYGAAPTVVPLAARTGDMDAGRSALLLIGDKVINAAPRPGEYPFELDLGEEWKKLTGLPFVFACWMVRADYPRDRAVALAKLLAWSQREGLRMAGALAARYAPERGWPEDLTLRYFTEYLRYTVTPAAREGVECFYTLAAGLGLLNVRRPVEYLE